MTNKNYIKRRNFIKNTLNDNEIAIFFSGTEKISSNDQFFPFEVNRSFYYLTGINEPNCILTINKDEEVLFVNSQEEIENKWVSSNISFAEAKEISGLNNIKENTNFDINNFNDFIIKIDLGEKGNKFNPLLNKIDKEKTINIFNTLADLRRIKDEEEILEIKKAIKVTKTAIEHMIKNTKNNQYEYELEADFLYMIKKHNQSLAFESIIASGENATILHYCKNNSKINNNDLILCDLGSESNKYCCDITRTFPKNGKFSERQKELYSIVLEGQKLIINSAKPGISTFDLNNILLDFYYEKLSQINLIKTKEDIKKYYFHGVSHQLGLDTHDIIYSNKTPLAPGCVITVEPGLYIKEENIGIRIEDDVLITKDSCIVLSSDIPKEIEDIEALMK